MSIVVKSCRYVVKSFKPLQVIENVDIVIDNGVITCIGYCKQYVGSGYEYINCEDCIAIPGFVSAHTHLLTNERTLLEKVLMILARYGYTLIHVMGPDPELVCEASKKVGLRVATGPTIKSSDDLKKLPVVKSLSCDMCIPLINIPTLEDVDAELLESLKSFMLSQSNVLLHVATSQQLSKTLSYYRRKGSWPVVDLDKAGLLTEKTCIAHLTWATTWEIERIMQRKAAIALTPYSDSMRGVHGFVHPSIFKLERIGLGLDDIYTREALTIVFDIVSLQSVYRSKTWGFSPTIEEVLNYATRGGSTALNFDSGVIDLGKKADIALFKLNKHVLSEEFSKVLLSSISTVARYTIVNGKIIWSSESEYNARAQNNDAYEMAKEIQR